MLQRVGQRQRGAAEREQEACRESHRGQVGLPRSDRRRGAHPLHGRDIYIESLSYGGIGEREPAAGASTWARGGAGGWVG